VTNFDGSARLPTNSGSSVIRSGWIYKRHQSLALSKHRHEKNGVTRRKRRLVLTLSSMPLTSLSLLDLRLSNGSASEESKFGSPEPGTRMLEIPEL
jgi:hypothetical protein